MKCPRDYQLYYMEKVRPKAKPIYFTLGSAVHAGLEAWRQGKPDFMEKVRDYFRKDRKDSMTQDQLHRLEVDLARAEGMVRAYTDFYAEDKQKYSMVAEQEFNIELIGDWRIMGFIDGVYTEQDGDGNTYAVENKTPGRLDPDYFVQARLDYQILTYAKAVKELTGEYPRGVMYDVLLKPAIRLKVKESKRQFQERSYQEYMKNPSKYLVRDTIWLSPKQIEDGWKQLQFFTKLLEAYAKRFDTKPWPKNTVSCISKYGSCRFIDICSKGRINKLLFTKGE
jgi:hypothetical protein